MQHINGNPMNRDYQKIQTLFLRDEKSIIIPSRFTCDEFYYLRDLPWEVTEKIDGTNIHVDFIARNGGIDELAYHGRTEKASIPPHLMAKLQELLPLTKLQEVFAEQVAATADGTEVVISLYGEGYGAKIQKGGNYIPDGCSFILFDVRVGKWWLRREACEDIARRLDINIVPLIGMMTIPEAIAYVKTGFKSAIAANKDYDAEGLVLKTPCGLLDRSGQRIITKIKTCDFRKFTAAYGDGEGIQQNVNPHYNQ